MALDSLDYIRVKPALNAEMLRKYIYISLLFISFSNFNVIKTSYLYKFIRQLGKLILNHQHFLWHVVVPPIYLHEKLETY